MATGNRRHDRDGGHKVLVDPVNICLSSLALLKNHSSENSFDLLSKLEVALHVLVFENAQTQERVDNRGPKTC